MTSHLGFVVAAYAVAGIAVATMIAAVLLDHRDLLARLARLERREPPR